MMLSRGEASDDDDNAAAGWIAGAADREKTDYGPNAIANDAKKLLGDSQPELIS